MADYLPGFLERVTEWCEREQIAEGCPAVSIHAHNDAWVGDTERGFHDELELVITFACGAQHEVSAAQQESLWHWIINGAPTATEGEKS